VTWHDHPVHGHKGGEGVLHAEQDPGCLGQGRVGAHSEVHLGQAEAQVFEQGFQADEVIGPAGVDEALLDAPLGECPRERSDLHEGGSCADEVADERHGAQAYPSGRKRERGGADEQEEGLEEKDGLGERAIDGRDRA